MPVIEIHNVDSRPVGHLLLQVNLIQSVDLAVYLIVCQNFNARIEIIHISAWHVNNHGLLPLQRLGNFYFYALLSDLFLLCLQHWE